MTHNDKLEVLFPLATLLEKLGIAGASQMPVPSRVAWHRAMQEMMKLTYGVHARDMFGL